MPFPTLPPSHPSIKKLREALNITTVPTLITVNEQSGEVINHEAASVVEDDPDGLRFPWKPKELPPVSRFYPSHEVVTAVHENVCCVLFVNGAANKVSPLQEFSRAAVLWDAQRNNELENSADKVRFFTVDEDEAERGFFLSVLRSLSLKPPLHGQPALVLFYVLNQDRALIPAPTRELAVQIDQSLQTYGRHLNFRHAVILGGVPQNAKIAQMTETRAALSRLADQCAASDKGPCPILAAFEPA